MDVAELHPFVLCQFGNNDVASPASSAKIVTMRLFDNAGSLGGTAPCSIFPRVDSNGFNCSRVPPRSENSSTIFLVSLNFLVEVFV